MAQEHLSLWSSDFSHLGGQEEFLWALVPVADGRKRLSFTVVGLKEELQKMALRHTGILYAPAMRQTVLEYRYGNTWRWAWMDSCCPG